MHVQSEEKYGGTRGFFSDQFENLANLNAHYLHTGPEIWQQAGRHVDAFVCAAGTCRIDVLFGKCVRVV